MGSEFQIKSIENGLTSVFCSTPVRHEDPIEFPVGFQYLVQILIVSAELSAIFIVCSHDAPRPAIDDRTAETFEIYLMQRAVTYNHIHFVPIDFLIVQRQVFYTCCHSIALNAFHDFCRHDTRQKWIFAHVFKIPAAVRMAVDIDSRGKCHILSALEKLFS